MPTGSKGEKERKRRIVAKGIAAGKRTKAIAKEAKCTTRHVQALAKEPATRIIITELLAPYRAQMEAAIPLVLQAIKAGLKAKKTDSADHKTRLRATDKLHKYMELAQGVQVSAEREGVTVEELTVLYKRYLDGKQETTVSGS